MRVQFGHPSKVIIAGTKKCGTSSLVLFLDAHPEIEGKDRSKVAFYWPNFAFAKLLQNLGNCVYVHYLIFSEEALRSRGSLL